MIDILLIELGKYKVISLLKCKYAYFEQPSRASPGQGERPKERGKKAQRMYPPPLFFPFFSGSFRTSLGPVPSDFRAAWILASGRIEIKRSVYRGKKRACVLRDLVACPRLA